MAEKIYVQMSMYFRRTGNDAPPNAMYVIEEKPSSSPSCKLSDLAAKRLPDLSTDKLDGQVRLAAVKSKLYVIARHDGFMVMDLTVEDNSAEWKSASLRNKRNETLSVFDPVVGQDGCVYVVGRRGNTVHRIRHDDVNGDATFITPVCSMEKSIVRLISVDEKNLFYMVVSGGVHDICRYDLESKQHHTVAALHEFEATGICQDRFIPYGDGGYFCLYRYSESEERLDNGEYKYKHVPGIYIYDVTNLKRNCGAGVLVQNLPNDGRILPRTRDSYRPLKYHDDNEIVLLLQLGTHHGRFPKLAMVWTSNDDHHLRFCKFIIHIVEGETFPAFKAEILSYGSNKLDSDVGTILDCTSRVMLTDGDGNKKDSRLADKSLAWEEVKFEEENVWGERKRSRDVSEIYMKDQLPCYQKAVV